MCGIVGYWGKRLPQSVILEGLKKLEYRGYDSAGIAIIEQNKMRRMRASGKLIKLEEKLVCENFKGEIGIGHTRWATHGVPSETNAHPHESKGICLVHNGIIENYQEIRAQLIEKGIHPLSETDSELVVHLLAQEVEKGANLASASMKVRPQLHGAFSIVTINEKEPDTMVAFKDGPPLIVGYTGTMNSEDGTIDYEEVVFVSDVQAALNVTKNFIYLRDSEIAVATGKKLKIYDIGNKQVKPESFVVDWNSEQAEKKGFSHFMLKEIHEQSLAVSKAITPFIDFQKQEFNTELVQGLQGARRILISACGSSYYAALYAKYIFESVAKIPVEVDVASELRYRQPVLDSGTVVFTISQSGETADTLAVLRAAKKEKLKVASLCNVKNSTIDREADFHLFMNSGIEVGVASTKAFMSSICVLNCIGWALAKAKGLLPSDHEKQAIESLLSLPNLIETVLSYDKYFAEAADVLKKFKGFLYVGRGVQFPIALEGALKLKELAYLHAEGFAAGEMKHGPLALIDEKMAVVVLAPHDQWYEKTISNLEEARARGGKIITLSNMDNSGKSEKLKSISQYFLSIPKASWSTYPMLTVVPLQLLAFHVANSLGYDVDQPRNLAKSVTVE